MRHLCDLHTHSTASDGRVAPHELVRLADRCRLAAVALTDHDTIAGLADAAVEAERFDELTFIGGIELSAAYGDGDVHILGYHVDPAAASLQQVAADLRSARDRRNPEIIARLQAMGVDITMNNVTAAAVRGGGRGVVIGRPHIAAALIDKGYVKTVADAFDRYVGDRAPAYVTRDRPAAAEAIAAIHDAGGVAVWAHPVHLGFTNFAQCERVVRSLMVAGLDGVEAYHGDHNPLQTRMLVYLARRFDLVVTGGSDYHGPSRPDVRLGRPRVPAKVVGPLADRAKMVRTTKATQSTRVTKGS